jgi:hypothetical protein
MLDLDIPLNAGCLVPLTSKCNSCGIQRCTPILTIYSPYSQEIAIVAVSHCCCLRRERADLSTYRGCRPEGIPRLCREPRVHQVRLAPSFSSSPTITLTPLFVNSNLTFGAGGKDKDGKNIAGWGYYEVCGVPA